jgi:putative transposase
MGVRAQAPSRYDSAASPRASAYAERFVLTARIEITSHLLIRSEQHLRRILAEYGHRPHQARGQRPPLHESGHAIDLTARIKRKHTLQGLISEYRRAA